MSEHEIPSSKSDKPSEIEITLPEGQKLTIRALEPGSVVEVASWRGTGKPDESAIRMLFGATGTNTSTTERDDANEIGTKATDEIRSPVEPIHQTEDYIATRYQKKLERLMEERKNSRRVFRRIVGTSVSILVLAGAIVALHTSGVAEFHRPDSGITTGLGPASSSIAIVNNGVDIVSSSTVLVSRGNESVLAGVAEVGDGELVVFDETGKFTVNRHDVRGRVLFVLPFLGYLGG